MTCPRIHLSVARSAPSSSVSFSANVVRLMCRISVSPPGTEPRPQPLRAQYPEHWATRELPTALVEWRPEAVTCQMSWSKQQIK